MKFYLLNRNFVLLIIALLGINLTLAAQDTLQTVTGTIRNSTNYEPISFALVKNEMIGTKVISDEQGRFSTSINRGDLLKITAIGYEDGFYIVSEKSSVISNFPIQLKPRIYELKEFTITPYKTVMQFKHALTQLRLPEEKHALIHIIVPNPNRNNQESTAFDQILGAASHPFSFYYNTFSHAGKMLKKYNRLIAKDEVETTIHKRLNFEFVTRIVPIHNEMEFEAFLEFCEFDLSFVLNISDYELIAAVQNKYRTYLLTKIP